jgi:hypothetical protein
MLASLCCDARATGAILGPVEVDAEGAVLPRVKMFFALFPKLEIPFLRLSPEDDIVDPLGILPIWTGEAG